MRGHGAAKRTRNCFMGTRDVAKLSGIAPVARREPSRKTNPFRGYSGRQDGRSRSSRLTRSTGTLSGFVVASAGRDLFERLPAIGENGCNTGGRLIAADYDVNLERIALDAAAHPPGILGCDQGRSGAKEGTEHKLAAVGEVSQRVLEHGGGFHGREILSPPLRVRSRQRRISPLIRGARRRCDEVPNSQADGSKLAKGG
jgi:hypothetical protein